MYLVDMGGTRADRLDRHETCLFAASYYIVHAVAGMGRLPNIACSPAPGKHGSAAALSPT